MGQRKEIYLKPQSRRGLRCPPPPDRVVVCFARVCDCHEFTSPESCPGAIPLASAGRDGSPAHCGSARVRNHCHQRGDPLSPALRGPRRRVAAGWGPRSPGRSRSSPARNLQGERLLSLDQGRASLLLCPQERGQMVKPGPWGRGGAITQPRGTPKPEPTVSQTGQRSLGVPPNFPRALSAKLRVSQQDAANLCPGSSFVKRMTPFPACPASVRSPCAATPPRAPAHVGPGSTGSSLWMAEVSCPAQRKQGEGHIYPLQASEAAGSLDAHVPRPGETWLRVLHQARRQPVATTQQQVWQCSDIHFRSSGCVTATKPVISA